MNADKWHEYEFSEMKTFPAWCVN